MTCRRRILQASIAMVIAICVLMSGCAGIKQRREAPRIMLAHVTVGEVRAFESEFDVQLRVFNTRNDPLTVKGMECELALNGRKLAMGVTRPDTTIPAFETDVVEMKLYSSMIDVVRGLMQLPREKELTYVVSGTIHFLSHGVLTSSVPFFSEGKIKLDPAGRFTHTD